ncbi:MAG: rhomboid family intramembrane serine protease [Bacteroidota bacterium]
MSILRDIRLQFSSGNVVTQLIIVNVAVFLAVNLVRLALFFSGYNRAEIDAAFYGFINDWLAMPLSVGRFVQQPWTLLTHFFLHADFFHIFWNMIMLFVFGRIFQEFTGNSKILSIYFYAALAGALLTFVAYLFIPTLYKISHGSTMLGASAGIMGLVLAAATLVPDYMIGIIFIGAVRLKYVAAFVVLLDIISIPYFNNTGGHIAHLGGALFGFLFVTQMKRGRDWSKSFNLVFGWIRSLLSGRRRARMKVAYTRKKSDAEYNFSKAQVQQKVDEILDKISRSGYESLSKEEKDFLFKASNKK